MKRAALSPAALRRALPAAARGPVARLVAAADRRDAALYLVGGPVRDLLLGLPLRDLDFCVGAGSAGGPEESAALIGPGGRQGRLRVTSLRRLRSAGAQGRTDAPVDVAGAARRRSSTSADEAGARMQSGLAAALAKDAAQHGEFVRTHDRFGTAKLHCGELVIDLAAMRDEHYRHPGALPAPRPAGLLPDLQRRDFTVNALAMPLSKAARRASPGLVDPGQGLADLQARRLRIFHPRSFHDDPTRALRAARLGARLGFSLERGSLAALREAREAGAFDAVSGARILAEFEKLFEDAAGLGLDLARAFAMLERFGVLAALAPGLALPVSVRSGLRRLGPALAQHLARASKAPPSLRGFPAFRPWLCGLMLFGAAQPAAARRKFIKRLALSGEPARAIAKFPALRAKLMRGLDKARGRGDRDALLSAHPPEALLALGAGVSAPVLRRMLHHLREDRAYSLPISGADITAAGGRGPAVGKALAAVRRALLNGEIRGRRDALALAERVLRRSARRR